MLSAHGVQGRSVRVAANHESSRLEVGRACGRKPARRILFLKGPRHSRRKTGHRKGLEGSRRQEVRPPQFGGLFVIHLIPGILGGPRSDPRRLRRQRLARCHREGLQRNASRKRSSGGKINVLKLVNIL
jgi:hypothetical protein